MTEPRDEATPCPKCPHPLSVHNLAFERGKTTVSCNECDCSFEAKLEMNSD